MHDQVSQESNLLLDGQIFDKLLMIYLLLSIAEKAY
jgi:hypothetical protein